MPFLEVLTRSYKRPGYLAQNQASLRAQTDSDWQQTLLVDEVGRGVPWANRHLGAYAPNLVGDYIWVLDDDDECILPTLVADLKQIVAERAPNVVMLRGEVGSRVLPDPAHWQQPPVRGEIGMSNFILRRSVWQANAPALHEALCADHSLIGQVLRSVHIQTVVWLDVVAMRTQRVSRGRPE